MAHIGSKRLKIRRSNILRGRLRCFAGVIHTAGLGSPILASGTIAGQYIGEKEEKMKEHKIYISAVDAEKLRDLIWHAQSTEYRQSPYLKMLAGELDRAEVVDPEKIPSDVITMNSTASLVDVESNEEMLYTLVFPEAADPIQGKISVLAPIGTAMLGYRVGDTFEWETPDGMRKIRVDKVIFQPEASGDYQ